MKKSPGRGSGHPAAARFDAMLTTEAMDEAGKNAWRRPNGVYTQELATWRGNAMLALSGNTLPPAPSFPLPV